MTWAGLKSRIRAAFPILLCCLLLLPAGSLAAEAIKRLILTDGTYQTATEWKQDGDRVRYLSAERGEWEEIPSELVDWKATEQWNAQAAKSREEELKQVTGEEVAARKQELLNTPQVMPEKDPELRLPSEGGVFLLEERAGKPVLQQVKGSNTQENDHEAANRLRKTVIPLAGQTQTIELKGGAAKARVHAGSPALFVDVENEDGPIRGDDFRIVRVTAKHGVRVVTKNKGGITGEQSVKQAVVQSRAEHFSGDWWKLTPTDPLVPGEYAVVIVGIDDSAVGLVWDFGVDR